jgi:hypothetical protein
MHRFGIVRIYLRLFLPANRIVKLGDPLKYDVVPLW